MSLPFSEILMSISEIFMSIKSNILLFCEKQLAVKLLSHLEEDLEIFSKSGAVVVPDRLGVAEALEEGRGLQDLLGDQVGGGLVYRRQVLHDQLGAEMGYYLSIMSK